MNTSREIKNTVLPNRFLFTKWFYKNFNYDKYSENQIQQSKFQPDISQKIIRDYVSYESPFRGVLVYHGLGTGKSCASILATDTFIKQRKNVIVLLPASLESNYRKELTKCSFSGALLKKKWNLVQLSIKNDMKIIEDIKKTLSIEKKFIEKKKGLLWLPILPADFPESKIKDTKTFRTMNEDEKSLAMEVYNYIIDTRYTFIRYNGLTNKKLDEYEELNNFNEDIFDNSIVVIDEVHTFISRVVNGGKIARRLYNTLISKTNIKLVLLSGTPIINTPFEICYTLNLLRGPLKEYTIKSQKSKEITAELDEIIDYLDSKAVYKYIDTLELNINKNKLDFTILPKRFVRKNKSSIELIKDNKYLLEDDNVAYKILKVLNEKYPVSKSVDVEEYTALPDNKEDFNKMFLEYKNNEIPEVNKENMGKFMRRIQGLVSYYKTADEELYPKKLETIYKNVDMSNYQFSYYANVRNDEIKEEERSRKMKRTRRDEDVFNINASYKAYSRMACNFVFPEDIKRPFPKDIKNRILKKEIDIADDDIISQTPTTIADKGKLYDMELNKALSKLEENGDKYLQGKGLYDNSPKMHTLLNDLTTNKKKSLLYSQFRTVEGLHIFSKVLEQAGWIEIDVKPLSGNDFEIVNANKVLDSKYNNKRYIIFGNKEKSDVLINLFNADMRFLPPTIQEQLNKYKLTENLRGKLASLLMITQSGAEGLNLRNVRFVYILEPFWNQVRIEQVIGRAIRKNSHRELPDNERNVQVVMYITKLNEKQAKLNKTIQITDNSKTTDEKIRELAVKKDNINQTFLNIVKSNAIDCIVHSTNNKPLEHNYKCYVPPMNIDLTNIVYNPNIKDDTKVKLKDIREKTISDKGKVVLKDDKKYVVMDNNTNKLYDYNAYKYAGVLMESI